tara:strand:+ start:1606 stop:2313 length:708 start_codon:yes stop_codon:yes gene_type:complete
MKIFLTLLFTSIIIISCDVPNKISLTKLEGSPKYESSKLKLNELNFSDDKYNFSFEVENYELGAQTLNNSKLANSGKGQHIHFILNNAPYSAHYSENFSKKLEEDNNVILAFLSRSYHESVKNSNAYYFSQIGDGEKVDLEKEYLFYSRPKGVYKGIDTEKLLLDFYLINTKISPTGNKVRATIQNSEFIIDEWVPYYIEGLPKGKISIKLELINSEGVLIDSPFNPSYRTVTLE